MENILRELIAVDDPLPGSYLARVNSVTPRTTREDVKTANDWLAGNGAEIVTLMGKGYKLEIKDDPLFREFLKKEHEQNEGVTSPVPNSPEDRVGYLLKRLLLSEVYVKLDDLAEEMFISKSTIQNDLKEVKELLARYDISLESRPNYGLKVKGDEVKLRFCLSEHLFNRVKTDAEFSIDSISQSDRDAVSEIIMRKIDRNQITLSDIAMNNLLIHIMIAYQRIRSGNYVRIYQDDLQEIEGQEQYEVAAEIVNEVERTLHVDFPDVEIAYIALHLLGTKLLSQSSEVTEQVMDEEIMELVHVILHQLEEKLSLDIKEDKELIVALRLHLKPAINRFKYGMNIRNPMLEDIKKNYPLAFEAGVVSGIIIEEHTGIRVDENEVGYLALHFGAAIERLKLEIGPKKCLIVCASGMGTAKLIQYKLKAYFGQNLEISGTTECYKLNQYDLDQIDFVVSSVPIREVAIPVIEVNAILNEGDLLRIEEAVVGRKGPFTSYVKEDLVYLQKDLSSKQEVLEFMSGELVERGLVEDTFLNAVCEREEVAPTSFGNLVAIPHPITPQSNRTFLSICTLKKPIIWYEKSVQFICFLCVKKDSQEDLQVLYEWLGKIIDSQSTVHQLIKAGTYREFIKVFDKQNISLKH
ncbi:BglG family transcription antiterminator [Halobacillus salinus]|uniref:BglG family transcription antiterminator n=1 Tax=Halobacillus salinus TaxID=192814 RepID=UPI00349F40F4